MTGRWVRRGEPGPYMVCGHGHGRGRIDEIAADHPGNTTLWRNLRGQGTEGLNATGTCRNTQILWSMEWAILGDREILGQMNRKRRSAMGHPGRAGHRGVAG